MPETTLIVGPPGTGKTKTLLDFFIGEVETLGPDRVSFCTFTRAATKEVQDRIERTLGIGKQALPWVRTIHSMAYRLLGLNRKQILLAKNWKEFAERHHYEFTDTQQTEDDLYEPPRQTDDDVLRAAYDWGRVRRLTPQETEQKWPAALDRPRFRTYVERFNAYKAEAGLSDFTDMLEQCLTSWVKPAADVAFIDEAQDLSPLQIAVVTHWFKDCERLTIAGDDDQAIFLFAGATPEWMLSLSKEYEPNVLEQSYRIPSKVHELARRVIQQNKQRIQKKYRPRDEAGELFRIRVEEIPKHAQGSVFVLARNKMFLGDVAKQLMDRYVPYVMERGSGPNPLGHPKIVRAAGVAVAVSRGENLSADDLGDFLEFVPSAGLVKRGWKTKVKEREGLIGAAEQMENMPKVVQSTKENGPASTLLRLPDEQRSYLQKLMDLYGDKLPRPTVRLTTIHGSKGREADTVIVLSDMARASYREMTQTGPIGREAENRVAYVAVTRARKKLVICEPETRMDYQYPR